MKTKRSIQQEMPEAVFAESAKASDENFHGDPFNNTYKKNKAGLFKVKK